MRSHRASAMFISLTKVSLLLQACCFLVGCVSQQYVLPTNAFESNLMRTSLANAAQSFGHSASQEGDEVIVGYATSVRIKYIVRDSVQMIVSSGLIARVLGSVDEKVAAAKARGDEI